jgi:hypothetical protein
MPVKHIPLVIKSNTAKQKWHTNEDVSRSNTESREHHCVVINSCAVTMQRNISQIGNQTYNLLSSKGIHGQ